MILLIAYIACFTVGAGLLFLALLGPAAGIGIALLVLAYCLKKTGDALYNGKTEEVTE